MTFISNLGNLQVIDKVNHVLAKVEDGFSTGLKARNWEEKPLGTFCQPLDIPLIPRSEWKDRIEEQEKTQSRLVDLLDVMNVPVKNQQQTNYCWINAPVFCLEVIRAVQGQKYIELSPASVGAKIKNFKNVGGWGTEGLQYLVDHGAVPASLWPCNAIDRKYDTKAADAERPKYQVDEWYELRRRSFDQLMTCLLLRIPVAIGLNWWGHEVTALSPVVLSGRDNFGAIIGNSWGVDWGDRGRAVLTEAKATPDDAVAPRVAGAF